MADVWDSAIEGATATHVMAVLANSADDDGMNCFPGTRLIARRARLSERTVIRTIRELELSGYLKIGTPGGGSGRFSEYHLNATRLHEEAEKTRIEEREKRCHHVTLSRRGKVTSVRRIGDIDARIGDIDATKVGLNDRRQTDLQFLSVLPVLDPSEDPLHPQPLASEGRWEIDVEHAVDQVCSALGISNRRKRRPLRYAIEQAMEKGDPAPTVALAMIAAVREQAEAHASRQLKFQFGIEKFIGLGIWRDKNRWAWDNEEIRMQSEARVGSAR